MPSILARLGEQQCYPQFYWQQRNGDEELAALGAVVLLSGVSLAVLSAQHAPEDTRICGLNAFNPEQGSLFYRVCCGDVPLATPRCVCSCGATARLRTMLTPRGRSYSNCFPPDRSVRSPCRLSAKPITRKNRNGLALSAKRQRRLHAVISKRSFSPEQLTCSVNSALTRRADGRQPRPEFKLLSFLHDIRRQQRVSRLHARASLAAARQAAAHRSAGGHRRQPY